MFDKKKKEVSNDGDGVDSNSSCGSSGSSGGSRGSVLENNMQRAAGKVKMDDVHVSKKMKEVVEEVEEEYDSDDLEVQVMVYL
uniref:Uncharacterized protein n=1 Tax=Cannabis sativa TaxID=3483 RepID=A0A803QI09_CANSA